MSLTASDRTVFSQTGILRLNAGVSKKQVEKVKQSVISELERLKLKVKGKLVAPKIKALPIFQQTTHLGQAIKVGPELDALFSTELLSSMSELAGTQLKLSQPRPQLLLSLPHNAEWSLNALNWHLDLSVPKVNLVPGVQAFVLVDDVQPHGGATLALAGSHRLPYLNEGGGLKALNVLRGHVVFAELFSGTLGQAEKFFKPQLVNDVEVFVVEMHGRAGDVYLMDMRVLHSPSVNSTGKLRMMATQRLIRVG